MLRLGQRLIVAQLVSKTFADDVQSTFETFPRQAVCGGNKELLDSWLRHSRRWSDVGGIGVDWHFTPSHQYLILFGDDGVDDGMAPGSLCLQLGEKYIADSVFPGGGELGIEV